MLPATSIESLAKPADASETPHRMECAPGIYLLDKPVGPTSREALDVVQRKLRTGSLGHAGTLDPLASGLLVALVGKATRLQSAFMDARKRYTAVVRFGETSPTLDGEAPCVPTGVPVPDLNIVERAALLARFKGEILQAPPAHSAVKVDGKRSWQRARAGQDRPPAPRPVTIFGIEVVAVDGPDWTLDVVCGAGTYIRSLARDLGEALGCGARLFALRRTEASTFHVDRAVAPAEAVGDDFIPLSEALGAFTRRDVDRREAHRLRNGLPVDGTVEPESNAFAWWKGRPWCRLHPTRDGRVRSDLFIGDEADVPESADPGGPQNELAE